MERERLLDHIIEFLHDDIKGVVLRKAEKINDSSLSDDIDVLIDSQSNNKISNFLSQYGFIHSVDSKRSNIYLYGSKPHIHYRSVEYNLHFDVVNMLMHKSLLEESRPGYTLSYWLPLHQEINTLLKENIVTQHLDGRRILTLSPLYEMLHIICHIILDKQGEVSLYYRQRLAQLYMAADINKLSSLLELVFYKFTPTLLNLCRDGKSDKLYSKYIAFTGY